MSPIKQPTVTRIESCRDGISIIEVLTSLAVATIGVFGVMVMIPFAVQQSQSGLDNDAANGIGRNAIEDLQVNALLRAGDDNELTRIRVRVTNDNDPAQFPKYDLARVGQAFPMPFQEERRPGILLFDPIGFAAGLTELNLPPLTADPAISIPTGTATNLLPDLTYAPFTGAAIPSDMMSVAEANRLCRSRDDLVHGSGGESVEDIAPPQPVFDVDGAGVAVKRQFSGRLSWSVLMVPEIDPGMSRSTVNRFRAYSLVYADRFLNPDDPVGSNYGIYLTNMARPAPSDSYLEAVNQITFDGVDLSEIGKDDWVMLVNLLPENDSALGGTPLSAELPGPGGRRYRAAANGFRTQVAFCRVTRVGVNSLAVDGGSFDFVPAGIPAETGGSPPSSPTYMVHLKNVVNVYDRSVTVER